jgi:hypothetical protein
MRAEVNGTTMSTCSLCIMSKESESKLACIERLNDSAMYSFGPAAGLSWVASLPLSIYPAKLAKRCSWRPFFYDDVVASFLSTRCAYDRVGRHDFGDSDADGLSDPDR